ncbi:hypothetical protein [Halobellus ruber]|uniref:Uncharacterized protein n=1 Tax=Halobellus ruber TaxID=2761102 RepID=A0A7J9SIM2_9EURY|nr:hypothetical protein [Halobellus ruber]MBB6646578.1 hypothetical protein [Halobellus ruber]
MRARELEIAGRFRSPTDYGIPELPDWQVCRPSRGGVELADDGDTFIRAEDPIRFEENHR